MNPEGLSQPFGGLAILYATVSFQTSVIPRGRPGIEPDQVLVFPVLPQAALSEVCIESNHSYWLPTSLYSVSSSQTTQPGCEFTVQSQLTVTLYFKV